MCSCLCRYAVACFLLQAKDRHNGNILVSSRGHLVHIDFGFILEISPGGNLGFESAAFKLSHEMTQLLDPGGTQTSPQFALFQELCIRGYLAVSAPQKAPRACAAGLIEQRATGHNAQYNLGSILSDTFPTLQFLAIFASMPTHASWSTFVQSAIGGHFWGEVVL